MSNYIRNPGSFKDPSGFVFSAHGVLYRQVNKSYAAAYDQLMQSGLYALLTGKKLLVPHQEVAGNLTGLPDWYKTISPIRISVISYPYEWCFEQLRDAGLLTLQLLRHSLDHGLVLKDATPFNIQFQGTQPVWIDTLSFAPYDPTQPWIAYRQFCECYLFPLYLEHYLATGLQPLRMAYPDGISVALTAKLLPFRSRWNMGAWLHVFLQNRIAGKRARPTPAVAFSKNKLLHLIDHLESILKRFPSQKGRQTTWSDYYASTILSQDYLQQKEKIFHTLLAELPVGTALDLGANEGYFSRILAKKKWEVIATDTDSQCISNLYVALKQQAVQRVLPLVADVSHPSPALGFRNEERAAFHQRIHTDLVVALALVHHLVIGKNIPLPQLAAYLHAIAPHLIIEFVGKEDEKVQQMLLNREDIFDDYTIPGFEAAFAPWFQQVAKVSIPGTSRILYSFKRKST